MNNKNRPLSPHLSIYKPHITMVMSIMHRITGTALYICAIGLVGWLVAVAGGIEYFNTFTKLLNNWIGKIMIVGFVWAMVHHTLGGIKHIIQDSGAWLGKESVTRLAMMQPVMSVIITGLIIVWATTL